MLFQGSENLIKMQSTNFENVWTKSKTDLLSEIAPIWREFGGLKEEEIGTRVNQLLYLVRNEKKEIVGVSTAYKVYLRQLKNYFYAFRCMLIPSYRIPGLTSKLLVMSRDFLEEIHLQEQNHRPIGVVTLVENSRINEHRREAIWPASKMVFVGVSKEGHQLRVYYFKDARITP